ncbi:MAG: hypothetical protein ABIJ34_04135 [archaeon]
MEQKAVLCDSSSLISLTDGDLDHVLLFLKKNFPINFYIPPSVEEEMVTRPIKSDLKEYLFSAIRLKKQMRDGIITKVDSDVKAETDKILKMANNIFFVRGQPMRLMHEGEAEMVAMAKSLAISTLLVDERTTRLLIENPFQLKSHLEQEFKVNVMVQKTNLTNLAEYVKGMEVIRSSEIVVLAYENRYFDDYGDMHVAILRAALYRLKYSGCSIRFQEIEDFVRGLK